MDDEEALLEARYDQRLPWLREIFKCINESRKGKGHVDGAAVLLIAYLFDRIEGCNESRAFPLSEIVRETGLNARIVRATVDRLTKNYCVLRVEWMDDGTPLFAIRYRERERAA